MPEKNIKNKTEIAELVEGQRVHTTFNILKSNMDVLSLIAREQGLTKTQVIDKAFNMVCSEFKKTTTIDNAIARTNGYWFERDLAIFENIIGNTDDFCAYQIAHLYISLNGDKDRHRVFDLLKLNEKLDELHLMNEKLENTRKLNSNGVVIGFDIARLADGLNCVVTDLQECYLGKIIGIGNVDKLKKLCPDKFLHDSIIVEADQDEQEPVDLFPTEDD